ncbi:MAG: prepilin-type N-terminal cleavage/methylation domain-containing protein [Candidatus Portnoybacteria bacterium]|nr:prepilin-type N-terminal cleavage/methylation domain-containing protein [Candidatus Portnoybacteria bacterium]
MNKKGFSLIETVITIAIAAIVIIGVFSVLQSNIQLSGRNMARVGAVSLVNKRMEMLRNLSYEDVGTTGGIPSGDIPQEEFFNLNNINYLIKTFVQYVDDSTDGVGDDDENGITADYKRTRVEVSWDFRNQSDSVIAISNFAPKGIESIEGGGTLSISVFNAEITPVPGANVHIVNNDISPIIDINVQANDQGKVVFPGSPSVVKYEVVVSKDGYNSAQTYDANSENPNPSPGHLTILEGKTIDVSFEIDFLSSLTINTLASGSYPLGGVSFLMEGEKVIGTDADGEDIYKYSENHTTGVSGSLAISDLEWDVYDFSSFQTAGQVYDIAATSVPEPLSVEPGSARSIDFVLVPHAENTLLVTIQNAVGDLIPSASVRLFNSIYDKTVLTGPTGQSFFTPLSAGSNYSLEVIKAGYQSMLLENLSIEGQSNSNLILSEL